VLGEYRNRRGGDLLALAALTIVSLSILALAAAAFL
jgi:hypothetical protein